MEALVAVGAEDFAIFSRTLRTDMLMERVDILIDPFAKPTALLALPVDMALMHKEELRRVEESPACETIIACDVCKRKRQCEVR